MTFLPEATGLYPIHGVGNPKSPSLPDGAYELTVIAAVVNGSYGNGALAGNGIDPGTNHVVKGDAANNLFRLFGDGDGDGDGDVDDDDLEAFASVFYGIQPYNAAFDSDGDVDQVDFDYFWLRYGLSLP